MRLPGNDGMGNGLALQIRTRFAKRSDKKDGFILESFCSFSLSKSPGRGTDQKIGKEIPMEKKYVVALKDAVTGVLHGGGEPFGSSSTKKAAGKILLMPGQYDEQRSEGK